MLLAASWRKCEPPLSLRCPRAVERKGRWMMPSVDYRLAIKRSHCEHRSLLLSRTPIQMQITRACQNAVHAGQSALLAHADHVAISCPEKPCSILFIYSGGSGPAQAEYCWRTVEVYRLYLYCLVHKSKSVLSCDFQLSQFCQHSDQLYAQVNFCA